MDGRLDEAKLSAPDRALLEFCGQLTEAAYKVTDEHVQALRKHGLDEQEIAEAALVAALFAMFNRVADAFGLQDPGYFEMQSNVKPATQFEEDADD